MNGDIESCEIGLYTVTLSSAASRTAQDYTVMCGRTDSGRALEEAECKSILALPAQSYTESEHKAPHWLKSSGRPCPLDWLVPMDALTARQMEKLTPAKAEEVERMKLQKSGTNLDAYKSETMTTNSKRC